MQSWIAYVFCPMLIATAALADTAPQQTCPAASPIAEQAGPILQALRNATDEEAARALTNQMWQLWTLAPDPHAQALLDRGMERRAAHDLAAAAQAMDDLVAYCPDYAEGYNQRAFISFLRGDYAAAIPDLERALELRPDHFAARAGLALSLMSAGRNEAAQGMLRSALALNPWLPERRLLQPARDKDI